MDLTGHLCQEIQVAEAKYRKDKDKDDVHADNNNDYHIV